MQPSGQPTARPTVVPTAKPTPEPSIQAGVDLAIVVFTFDVVSVVGNPFMIVCNFVPILIDFVFMLFRI
jgi:hypothetical protein